MNQTSDNFKAVTGAKPRPSRAKARPNATAKAAAPTCPRWLSAEARAEWVRVVGTLRKRGVLSKADTVTLEVLCNATVRYRAAQRSIDTEGVMVDTTVLDSHGVASVVRKLNPALKIVESCQRTLMAFAREMGSTPRSRDQVKPAPPGPGEQKAEPKAYDLLSALKRKHGEK
jgi:P27 family predicted phage terminase small subunit